MKHILAALAALALMLPAAGAHAYPDRPLRILVPFTPGGSTDILARMIGQKLTEAWGQQVVVDNRPGANGVLAAQLTTQALLRPILMGTRCSWWRMPNAER